MSLALVAFVLVVGAAGGVGSEGGEGGVEHGFFESFVVCVGGVLVWYGGSLFSCDGC